MKQVNLTKGYYAIIDENDFEILSSYSWQISSKGYAKTRINSSNGEANYQYMHRLILGIKDSKIWVDHINGNRLDNRKENLRICSTYENAWNSKKSVNKTSIYKGVIAYTSRHGRKSWRARITYCGNQISLGLFNSEIEAAIAYNNKAIELFGSYANLNQDLDGNILATY